MMTATCWLRSSRLALILSSCSDGSATSLATSWAGNFLILSLVIRLTPDRPASRASHVLATSGPSGVVAPRPVTTTSVADVLMVFLPERGTAGRPVLRKSGPGRGPLQGPAASVRAVGGR